MTFYAVAATQGMYGEWNWSIDSFWQTEEEAVARQVELETLWAAAEELVGTARPHLFDDLPQYTVVAYEFGLGDSWKGTLPYVHEFANWEVATPENSMSKQSQDTLESYARRYRDSTDFFERQNIKQEVAAILKQYDSAEAKFRVEVAKQRAAEKAEKKNKKLAKKRSLI